MEETNSLVEEQPKQKKFIQNFIIVLISNGLTILSGILVGFIIPKIMGVTDYGYYKTFTLFSSYIGLFHFGFIDGIYLYFAGKEYKDLDKFKFRTYSRFLFLIELGVTLLVSLVALSFIGTSSMLIFLFVALNVLAINITTYFEFISQITMRFKQLSIRSIIKCTATAVSVIVLYLLYKFSNYIPTYQIYVIIVLGINYILALWYIISYRELVFGKSHKFKEEWPAIKSFFKVGMPLLLANLIAQLVFVIDQQFVNILFSKEDYATYAFAYNMVNLITVATGAISTVLYPTLKRMNPETIKNNYARINAYLMIFVFFCMIIYYPLDIFIRHYLKDYISSLQIFRIILPGLAISSSISVIKYNCYKTFGKVKNYFVKSLLVLVLSIVANVIVYLLFKNMHSISIVSLGVLLVWYILVESYFIRTYKVHWIRNLLYLFVMIAAFYGISFIPNIYMACGIYLLSWIGITCVMYIDYVKHIFLKILK
ncbi:MAG: oligosaccharide flippase family protein [Anaeroplasmataceae bacterium]|nr:oligosaccharide flippase family protein [Anaeroplasmataceae bacterium]